VRRHARIEGTTDRRRTAAVLSTSYVALVTTDLRGTITGWNAAAERLLGWQAGEVLGRPVSLVVPEDRRGELDAVMAAIGRGDSIEAIDSVRRTKDGTDLSVHLQMSPIVDEAGDLTGASAFLFENSEQVQTRTALAASEARYRTLVEALTEVVLVTNTFGRVTRPQPSWTAYTGQSTEACNALGWRDALHPHDRAVLDVQWDERTARRAPFSFGARVFNEAADDYRQCEVRVAPMVDHVGVVVEWVAAFSDVHERFLAEERERQIADRFRRVFDANVFGICYGEGMRVYDANDAMLDMFGAGRDELNDGGLALDRFFVAVGEETPFGDGVTTEVKIRKRDGSLGYMVAAGVKLAAEESWLAVAVDVTERKATEQEIEYRAMHDPLTGLPNRRLLLDRLEHAIVRSGRVDTMVGLLFCDLDHFKAINDVLGHAAGDRALEVVAARLQGLVREGDTVARTGGDEFVLVLEDLVEPEDATRIAERVRMCLREPVEWNGGTLNVSGSIGVTLSTGVDDRVETLLSRADHAMYEAKQSGRDQISLSVGAMESKTQRRWVERELERALAEGLLELEFQPVIDLRDGSAVGAEALLRWRVDGELVPTARVISVAEETGIIIRLSEWVIREACRQFGEWRTANNVAFDWRLHVNISARDLADELVVTRVLDAIKAGGLEPGDVCLEVTETAMVRHPERAHARLSALREAGLVVAIDDFGTGYASLGVLRDVPADIVKIDRAFVVALDHSERDRAIVEHAIELAHRLGLTVVGEGVETLAQLTILDELGCDHAQGYAFAHPKPVEHLPIGRLPQ
jgi:diguanylate cyclase (GGDEF)-like protein/PAS domain S-box-containing protein